MKTDCSTGPGPALTGPGVDLPFLAGSLSQPLNPFPIDHPQLTEFRVFSTGVLVLDTVPPFPLR